MSIPAQSDAPLAQVAVWDATIYYDKLYTYLVPAHLAGHIFVGSLVLVPFGRGAARPRLGVVIARQQGPPPPRAKTVLDAAPEEAVLTEELLALATYLREATFCTWYEAVRAVLPRGAQYRVVKGEDGWRLQQTLARTQEVIYTLPEEDAQPAANTPPAGPEATAAGANAAITQPATPPATKAPAARRLTDKQQAVLALLRTGPHSKSQLCAALGIGPTVAENLARRGLVCAHRQDKPAEEDALLAPRGAAAAPGGAQLSADQQRAADALLAAMAAPKPKPALLYGVTGSGKTQVFLHLIQKVLQQGKTALVLVPEIGLTPQMLGSLKAAFGSRVAVQHSGLAPTQRVLQWRGIMRGQSPVVVGTRSAVFAPLQNIGLIVVDEEQEHTYQSESSPRYDAVAVARRRAARHGALLLLASATPRVATYHAAQSGAMQLVCLPQRYGALPLPRVQLVDMAAEVLSGNTGVLSAPLSAAIAETIAAGRQVILLLNKRGFHRLALCQSCRAAVKCPACDVPLVYHKRAGAPAAPPPPATPVPGGPPAPGWLACHHCGHILQPAPAECPDCGGALRYAGFGTQRLEEELAHTLPGARVLRMDMDTTARKGAHAALLNQFAAGGADILLGTQMVAKGLDFEGVGLVGVVGIDSLLFAQGYRAFERVFSLVTQVVGRSGRAGAPGQAIIQTADPHHPVLRLAAAQNYPAFYEEEIGFRQLCMYPPFCALCQVGFAAAEEADAAAAATAFAGLLAQQAAAPPHAGRVPLRVLGPSPMAMPHKAGSWRWRLTLKCRKDAAFRQLMWECIHAYHKAGWSKKATLWLDFGAE